MGEAKVKEILRRMDVNYIESIQVHLDDIRCHILDIEMLLEVIKEKRR